MKWVLSPSEMTDQGNNNQNISCNPFAALFSSLADAKQFASDQKSQQPSEPPRKSSCLVTVCVCMSLNVHACTSDAIKFFKYIF